MSNQKTKTFLLGAAALFFALIAGVVIYRQMRQLQPNAIYDNANFSPYGHGNSSMAGRMKNMSKRP
jgi:hypothetical protein